MTTKENVHNKVITLLDDIRPLLEKSLRKILDSGVIDFANEPDNYRLPKAIILAFAKEVEFQYGNEYFTRAEIKEINSLYKTIRNPYIDDNGKIMQTIE